jgi:hypothetical protein
MQQAVHRLVLVSLGVHDQAHLQVGLAMPVVPANLPERIVQLWVGALSRQPGDAVEQLSRWRSEARIRYRCPGLLACLALALGDEDGARVLIRLASEQRCLWWPLVRGLPPMSRFLLGLSSEACRI